MFVFNNSTGRLYSPDQKLIGIGYSGHEDGKNNPELQHVPDLGPIPCGMYTIGTPFDSPTHGPYCLRLTPDADNEMFGRSGFLMHGDSIVHPGMASLGCIIQMHSVRLLVGTSTDKRLKVISC